MAISIKINDLTLVHKDSGGVAKATLPNVCLTPAPGGPVPRNYSNTAYSKDIVKGTVTITADGGNMCANSGSELSKSTGDEAGVSGGVLSGTNSAEATWLTWSPDVFLEGKNACRLTDKMLMNHGNTACLAGIENPDLSASELLDKLLECEEAKERYENAKKANGGRDPEIVKIEDKNQHSGWIEFRGEESAKITINKTDSFGGTYRENFQMQVLCFELGNLERKEQFAEAQGMLTSSSQEDYVKFKEQIEYENAKETREIVKECMAKWNYNPQDMQWNQPNIDDAKDFETYYNDSIDRDHKSKYIKEWEIANPKKVKSK